jgi:serine protein kinase
MKAETAHAFAAERMITAIGDPVVVDTSKDSRLGRIFLNRTIKVYPSMAGFFGMEDTIQRVVSYFQHAAQGFDENSLLRLSSTPFARHGRGL